MPDWTFLQSFSLGAAPSAVPTWAFLDGFNATDATAAPSWRCLDRLLELEAEALLAERLAMAAPARRWHERLEAFGGEICAHDWRAFRPLRLSREEDWSDWLAHLLSTSRLGTFARRLFAGSISESEGYAEPTVHREVATVDRSFRADLVVLWRNGRGTHVEVKVGDESFDKTFETALGVRAGHPEITDWTDCVLIPEESRSGWEACVRRRGDGAFPISTLTWRHVASSLRRALWLGEETVTWRAWAYAFCGALEQQLLGHARLGQDLVPGRDSRGGLATAMSQLRIWEEAEVGDG